MTHQHQITDRAWAAQLAQSLDDLLDLYDPNRDDPETEFHRRTLARFDHWLVRQHSTQQEARHV